MQVERQPNPWPTAVVLAFLVALCLTMPRHWRKPARRDAASIERGTPLAASRLNADRSAPAFPVFGEGWERPLLRVRPDRSPAAQQPSTIVLDNNLLSLWPAKTIDELVAERIGTANPEHDVNGWLAIQPAADANKPARAEAVDARPKDEVSVSNKPLAEVFKRVGQAIVASSSARIAPQLVTHAARAYQSWSKQLASTRELDGATAASSLRLVGPEDRVVGPSEGMEKIPVIVPDDEGLDLKPEIDPWCVPQILLEQLQRIAGHESSREWAERTIAELRALTERESLDGDDVQAILDELCDTAREAARMADHTDDDRLRVELLRAHWALARRLDRWSVVREIRMAARAGERVAARGSLGTYFDGPPIQATEKTDHLTRQLETYEETRDSALGRQIVSQQRALADSGVALDRALADAVEQHYRNANVRVAIAADMLNRYVGQPRSETRALRERIGGAPVRGQSRLESSSRVRLDPAVGCWDLDIESQGSIQSNAVADGGQARFRSQTSTEFSARKRVVVDARGVLLQPASIDVDSHNRLLGVTTDVDWVPLFASFARERAAREYRARQQRAKLEVESKIAAEAVSTIDQESREAVARVEKRIRERVTDRLEKFGVHVTPIELTTTHDRVVARLRVASDDQLGSHTPRPRALSDSLVSAQVHETALTNAAVSLELDGGRYTGDELVTLFRKKFPQVKAPALDEEKRSTVFQFAKKDAVRFHIEDGQLEVTLSLAAMELDGRRVRNFVVHAFYKPTINGLGAELVRDGTLGIEGRLGAGERARLHNVFNSVLPPERTVPLLRMSDENDPRLAGLMITQFVLEDGWMGLAVGPTMNERVAERSRSLK